MRMVSASIFHYSITERDYNRLLFSYLTPRLRGAEMRSMMRENGEKDGCKMKKLILVTSPPACGKTFVSKQLAAALRHVVYLDKDTLIPLSRQIFRVAGQEYNRSSAFFEENIRDYEYETVVDLALEALNYDDIVLINAPFTREVRDPGYIAGLRAKLAEKGAKLVVIWVQCSPEVCRQRMEERGSDRDTWKLAHWDEYIAGVDFSVPTALDDPAVQDDLLLFPNSTREEFEAALRRTTEILEKP